MARGFSPGQPEETLGRFVRLGLELVDHQVLEGFRLEGGGELALSEFLWWKPSS